MPGIPLHTSSPISTRPLHPEGVTPSTTTGEASSIPQGPTPTSTLPTSTSTTTSARPGQPAMPAPTSSIPTPASYPTRTTAPPSTSTFNSPPPPQPGPTPIPSAYTPLPPSQQPSLNPLPPTPGHTAQASPYQPSPSYQPTPTSTTQIDPRTTAALSAHQQSLPTLSNTPTRAQPPASLTSTTPQNDLSHPQGYIQNSQAAFQERPIEPYRPFDSLSQGNSSGGGIGAGGGGGGGGILGGGGAGGGGDVDAGLLSGETAKNVWNTAASWVKTAGEKLGEAEAEVWKAINKEK